MGKYTNFVASFVYKLSFVAAITVPTYDSSKILLLTGDNYLGWKKNA